MFRNEVVGLARFTPRMSDRPRIDPGRQRRSRETFEAISHAAMSLLDGRDWDTISVAEICDAADVSASSFYARFADKDALFHHLHDRWLQSRRDVVRRATAEVPWGELSIWDAARAMARLYIEDRLDNEAMIQTMLRAQYSSPALADQRTVKDRELSDFVVGFWCHLLGPAADRTRVAFALHLFVGGIQFFYESPSKDLNDFRWSLERRIDEMARAFLKIVDGEEHIPDVHA